MDIQSLVNKGLYAAGSLKRNSQELTFRIRNILTDAVLTRFLHLTIDGVVYAPEQIELRFTDRRLTAGSIGSDQPLSLKKGDSLEVAVGAPSGSLSDRCHIQIGFETAQFGSIQIDVQDSFNAAPSGEGSVPWDRFEDHDIEWVKKRQEYLERRTGRKYTHIKGYTFDPGLTRGNIEKFTGVSQVPLGIAGPLLVRGENANGEFLIPLATTEGSLVASYSRGMKAANLSGGIKATVVEDHMQRAPVFAFDSAREARDLCLWVADNMASLREAAGSTSRVVRLIDVETYVSNRFAFLRFNYTTGDAAGQNMVGKATYAACQHIFENNPSIRRYYLESNMATDKKGSSINMLNSRGKRVIAEATIKRKVLKDVLKAEPEDLHFHGMIANVGAMMAGANNNGLHSANGITAMFIATGQDAANVAEASSGIAYSEIDANGDLYISITIPALIVATYGGGTGLATQRECLEMLGCYGPGNVNKLAEIVGAVVLAGELSLASAISSLEWVSSHERLGRNR
ncbi:MAG: hydroxymethylglutaryl-CoA reductase [Candidatus Thermoplasmatota archaeon]|nr:hydroxymethylglutaryl-CoA reductase [Candidatus Thermoplasmatota archaeon]